MEQSGARQWWVPKSVALLAGVGALAVVGYFAAVYVREELAIADLASPDGATRAAAAATLGELRTARAIGALLDCERPEDGERDVQRIVSDRRPSYVFDALDRIARSAAVGEILRMLRHPKAANRVWAAQALGNLSAGTEEVLAALAAAIEDEREEVASHAASALLCYGRRALPALLAAYERAPKHRIMDILARALESFGPLAWPAVETLTPRAFRNVNADGFDWILLRSLHSLDAGMWGQAIDRVAGWTEKATGDLKDRIVDCLSTWVDCYGTMQALGETSPAMETLLQRGVGGCRKTAIDCLWSITGRANEATGRFAAGRARDAAYVEEAATEAGFATFRLVAPTEPAELRALVAPLELDDPGRYRLLLLALAESDAHHGAALNLLQEQGMDPGSAPRPHVDLDAGENLLQWLEHIRSSDSEPHSNAIARLRRFEPSATEIALLERALKDPDSAVRALAANALGHAGTAARRCAPALEAVLADANSAVRVLSALALCKIGLGRPDLESLFRESLAARASSQRGDNVFIGLGGFAVAGLVRLHIAERSKLRELLVEAPGEYNSTYAFWEVEAMGAAAAPAVPLLRELVRDFIGVGDFSTADFAVEALGAIGPAAEAAAAELLPLCAPPTPRWRRVWALRALRRVHADGHTAQIHAEAFVDREEALAAQGASGLIQLAPHAAGTVPLLLSCLSRNFRAAHASAVLSRIGAPAVLRLLEALDDDSADLRTWAAWTLGGMEPGVAGEAVLEALKGRLRDSDDLVRAAAGHALGLMGRPAARAISALEAVANDSSALVRRQVATALRRLQEPGAWRPATRPGMRDLAYGERRFVCGTGFDVELEMFHQTICDRHRRR